MVITVSNGYLKALYTTCRTVTYQTTLHYYTKYLMAEYQFSLWDFACSHVLCMWHSCNMHGTATCMYPSLLTCMLHETCISHTCNTHVTVDMHESCLLYAWNMHVILSWGNIFLNNTDSVYYMYKSGFLNLIFIYWR